MADMVDIANSHQDIVTASMPPLFIRLGLSLKLRSMFLLFFLMLVTRCSFRAVEPAGKGFTPSGDAPRRLSQMSKFEKMSIGNGSGKEALQLPKHQPFIVVLKALETREVIEGADSERLTISMGRLAASRVFL